MMNAWEWVWGPFMIAVLWGTVSVVGVLALTELLRRRTPRKP